MLLLAAGCVSAPESPTRPPQPAQGGGIYKVGQPYQIGDTWYYPREQPDYDETGVASWYGPTFYGRKTANGEVFDAEAMTAAHRTLPMPVNVRVTNLDNGKSVVLRVNDRGPFAKGRIIDVSEAAAKLLDFYGKGTARVRVTYLTNAEINGRVPPPPTPTVIATAVAAAPTAKVDAGALDIVPGAAVAPPVKVASMPIAAPSLPIPAPNLEPTGQVTKVPVPAVTNLYVQAGAFSTYENASRLIARLGPSSGLKVSTIEREGRKLFRVRAGPFSDVAQADAALAKLSALGSNDAQIVVDR